MRSVLGRVVVGPLTKQAGQLGAPDNAQKRPSVAWVFPVSGDASLAESEEFHPVVDGDATGRRGLWGPIIVVRQSVNSNDECFHPQSL